MERQGAAPARSLRRFHLPDVVKVLPGALDADHPSAPVDVRPLQGQQLPESAAHSHAARPQWPPAARLCAAKERLALLDCPPVPCPLARCWADQPVRRVGRQPTPAYTETARCM